ncbi:MAG: histidine phosphatase family protein, partial [Ilumatobacteraceae bacterium]
MELILVRHGLPERREATDGPADPPLAAIGHLQAEHMADYLASEHIDAIYTSPMRRARQTAAPLAERLGMAAVVVDDVAEYDRNASDYIPLEELKAANDPRFHDFAAGIGTGTGTGLDVHEGFVERVLGAIESIIDRHRGERVAVVCHGGVINVYLASLLGVTTEPPGFFYPNYTSIHRVAASSSGVRSVVTVNETSH